MTSRQSGERIWHSGRLEVAKIKSAQSVVAVCVVLKIIEK